MYPISIFRYVRLIQIQRWKCLHLKLRGERVNKLSCIRSLFSDMLTRISPVENVNYIEDLWRELYDSHADIKDLFTERIGLTNEAFQLLGT